jgi:2-polyprenyl-3-methyl-5-hydroxy-6-metoxy-1,4-benzoquinol methylase
MNADQRARIRDTAKYLREVRPIDPEEVYEYVEGQPHPAAVRQVLRESATDLGLIERPDGTFEPVSESPLTPDFHGVERVPETVASVLDDRLVETFGPEWPHDASGDRLRSLVRDFKHRYLRGETVTYDVETALGYAIYHLPSYFAATQYVLADLAAAALLPSNLRVLDVGAGVGGPALGLDAFVPDDALVEYHAVEPSDAVSVLNPLLETTGRNVHTHVHQTTIETFEPEGSYDLILCANVLSELDEPSAVLADLFESLDPTGTVLALAPADRQTATHLRTVERRVEHDAGATVYAPTVRLWPNHRPESECWSFDRKPDLAVTDFQRRLDEGRRGENDAQADRKPGDGEFVNVDVQYAYSLLRADDRVAIDFTPTRDRYAMFASSDERVTERIDCVAVKLSHDLSDGGNPLFLVGDGSERRDHFAVCTKKSALNRDLGEAGYGDLLAFENVLLLYNDDEAAYNLVVDGETVVDRIPV